MTSVVFAESGENLSDRTTYSTNPINEPTIFGHLLANAAQQLGKNLTRDEVLFFQKHPHWIYHIREATNLSFRIASALCSSDDPRGRGDQTVDNAVLHFVWSYFLTGLMGEELAREFLMAHEMVEKISESTLMDLRNNELGVRWAIQQGFPQVKETYFESRPSEFVRLFEPTVRVIRQYIREKKFAVLQRPLAQSTCQ